MPSPSSGDADAGRRHLEAVAHDFELATFLRSSGRTDPTTVGWAITLLFYAALHSVRAYLAAHHGVKVVAHVDMHPLLRKHPELKKTQAPYDLLKQKSEGARYYREVFTWPDYDNLLKDARQVESMWRAKAERAIAEGVPPS